MQASFSRLIESMRRSGVEAERRNDTEDEVKRPRLYDDNGNFAGNEILLLMLPNSGRSRTSCA